MITGIPPIDLIVDERVHKTGKEETLRRWQTRWEEYQGSKWTKALIPDVETWVQRKHGQLSYHLTQALTGHGCFNNYLNAIKKVEDPTCMFCDEIDDAEHTIFECRRWNDIRSRRRIS